MDPNKEIEVTPEEHTAEQEALKGATDEELREKIAEEMGLDPDTDADLLLKIVSREKAHREKLYGAIKQKIGWREKLKSSQKPPVKPGEGNHPKGQENPNVDELVDKKLNERLEARDLEELNFSDELKEEVKKLAKVNGISVRKAAQDPYIAYKKEQMEKEERIKNATPTRKGKGSYQSSFDPSKPLNYADFDLSTKEGRDAWNNAKAEKRKYQENHK